jgi:Asp-tRNA(Asn)/Glu-tRNA(Gln) amidotransferase C subunit
LKTSDVISGIRLYNKVKGVGLDISFFENFIEATNTKSFRLKKDHNKFLEEIKRIVQFEQLYGIKIEKIFVKMADTLQNLQKLREETKEKIEKIKNYIYNITRQKLN